MKNKKGMSTVIATLLIIILVLVAVGIIWVVLKNVINSGTNQVTIVEKCIQTDIAVTSVTNISTVYSVVLSRQSGIDDKIDGVRIVFLNETTSLIKDFSGNIDMLDTVTKTADVSLQHPNEVNVAAYFLDKEGNKQFCQSSKLNF